MNHTIQEKKTRYTIIVGANDKNTFKQKINTIKVIKLVHSCCKESGNAYSTQLCRGGYYHKSGRLVQEKSMKITLLETNEDTVNALAEKLCVLLNQESVLVCKDEVLSYFVKQD